MHRISGLVFLILLVSLQVSGQTAWLQGRVISVEGPVPYASISVQGTNLGAVAAEDGRFQVYDVPVGEVLIEVRSVGYQTSKLKVKIEDGRNAIEVKLVPDHLNLNDVVVSASRYDQDRKEAPVIVNVLSPEIMKATQSLAVSEGLNYQPGVRVENNCQNCGMTQVRLNGLDGAYSQILIDSRPVFSALNSVYGLDQIPSNIVKQVEVVRSGGSALYGSNAIAGTVNIITQEPLYNAWQIGGNYALIGGEASDVAVRYNGSVVNSDLTSGVTLYGMYRDRESFDANGDGFTELTSLENNTFGTQAFYKPGDFSKISINFNAINEYRRGGNKLDQPPQFTDITEELDHNTIIGGITYDLFSRDRKNKFSIYASGQTTRRRSYYGGLGGGRTPEDSALANNASGNTSDLALVTGLQWTRNFFDRDVLVMGIEHQHNSVDDQMPGYERLVDQSSNISGVYLQYEWKPADRFKALIGSRFDLARVNGQYALGDIQRSIDQYSSGVLSPRLTMMYDLTEELQLRGGYARGFRAPQAFNEELHIASVGGEPLFVILGDDLQQELSDAFTVSLNYSRFFGNIQVNALIEGFYTQLLNPFTSVSTGALLPNGSIVSEVRNGSGAEVQGVNFEVSLAPSPNYSFQLGGTAQQSLYQDPQVLYEPTAGEANQDLVLTDEFTRTPRFYGYFTSLWKPNKVLALDITGTYTGSMSVPRVINDDGRLELMDSDSFLDLNIRMSYDLHLSDDFEVMFSAGVQNILNSYQDDFDSGPTRDSQYVYGPLKPRTVFFGLTLGNIH